MDFFATTQLEILATSLNYKKEERKDVCVINIYLKYCQEVLSAVKNCAAEGLVPRPVFKIIHFCQRVSMY